jgi:hypothetical protein
MALYVSGVYGQNKTMAVRMEWLGKRKEEYAMRNIYLRIRWMKRRLS